MSNQDLFGCEDGERERAAGTEKGEPLGKARVLRPERAQQE